MRKDGVWMGRGHCRCGFQRIWGPGYRTLLAPASICRFVDRCGVQLRRQQGPVPEEGTVAWGVPALARATVCTVATGAARYGRAPMSRAGGTSRRALKAGTRPNGRRRGDPSQTNALAELPCRPVRQPQVQQTTAMGSHEVCTVLRRPLYTEIGRSRCRS